MAPIIISVCVAGAYSGRNTMFDVWICIFFGAVGWILSKIDWPVAPLVLGYILGDLLETALRQVYFMGFNVLTDRPIFYFFIVLAVISMYLSRHVTIAGDVEEN